MWSLEMSMNQEERQEFIQAIASAIRIRSTDTALSEEEIAAIRVMIKQQEILNQRQLQSIAFRRAIIEKSLGALLASVFIATAVWISTWFVQHIYKP
jgi:hypothetical protein